VFTEASKIWSKYTENDKFYGIPIIPKKGAILTQHIHPTNVFGRQLPINAVLIGGPEATSFHKIYGSSDYNPEKMLVLNTGTKDSEGPGYFLSQKYDFIDFPNLLNNYKNYLMGVHSKIHEEIFNFINGVNTNDSKYLISPHLVHLTKKWIYTRLYREIQAKRREIQAKRQ
tara:strand:- start:18 stop:530 length:513 start_codon:yes stop_codon:yes gene_type:complete